MSKIPAFIILILSISLSVVAAEVFFQPPILIHLSTEGDPSTTITVTWKTRGHTQTSIVQYGESGNYDWHTAGAGYTYYGALGVLHSVKIDGLRPDSLYHHRVGDSFGDWSSEHTFRTAPTEVSNFTFAVYGDHIYQRTFLLYNGSITSSAQERYTDPEGPIYVVTGGGGRSLYSLGEPEPLWSVKRESVYHFLHVSIEGRNLHLKAIKTDDGSILDQFHITKMKCYLKFY